MRTAAISTNYPAGQTPPIPGCLPASRLRVASAQWPQAGRSGDLLVVQREDDGATTIFMGDVSGNGDAVASTAARSRQLVSWELGGERSLGRAFASLNDALESELESDTFVTAVAARISADDASMQLVSAGHLGPFVRRARGGAEATPRCSGLPLGILRGQRFPEITLPALDPEDTLVFATDGVTDRYASKADCSGEAGLLRALSRLPSRPTAISQQLLRSRLTHLGTDSSVLAMQIAG